MFNLPKKEISSSRGDKNLRNQSGQALLIVLMVMAVALTVVLSSTGRSISDISTSEFEEDSSRAFSAAEAGIEEALLNPAGTSVVNVGGGAVANVNTSPSKPGTNDNEYRYPEKIANGEEAIFWFIDHDPGTEKLTCSTGECKKPTKLNRVCWGLDDTYTSGNYPAVAVTFYYDDTGGTPRWISDPGNFSNVKTKTIGYDANSSRAASTGFIGLDGTQATYEYQDNKKCKIGGASYAFEISEVNFGTPGLGLSTNCRTTAGCVMLVKMRMLYNSQPDEIAIDVPGGRYSPQGKNIDSTGSFAETQRRVQVFKGFAEPLDIFTGAIFSRDGLVHN